MQADFRDFELELIEVSLPELPFGDPFDRCAFSSKSNECIVWSSLYGRPMHLVIGNEPSAQTLLDGFGHCAIYHPFQDIAVVCSESEVRLVNMSPQKVVASYLIPSEHELDGEFPKILTINATGTRLALGNSSKLFIFDLCDLALLEFYEFDSFAIFGIDSLLNIYAESSKDENPRRLEVRRCGAEKPMFTSLLYLEDHPRLSPDGRFFYLNVRGDSWHGEVRTTVDCSLITLLPFARSICFLSGGGIVAQLVGRQTCSGQHRKIDALVCWKLADRSAIGLSEFANNSWSLVGSSHSNRLAIVREASDKAAGTVIEIYSASPLRVIGTFSLDRLFSIHQVALSPNGEFVFVSGMPYSGGESAGRNFDYERSQFFYVDLRSI